MKSLHETLESRAARQIEFMFDKRTENPSKFKAFHKAEGVLCRKLIGLREVSRAIERNL